MRKLSFYSLMTIISTFVRQFVLPNPFECFGDKAIIINWVAEPIIHVIAYGLVGLFYLKGSAPAIGSFLYLIVYCAIIGILWLMSLFCFAWWWDLIIVAVIVAFIYGGMWLKERFL